MRERVSFILGRVSGTRLRLVMLCSTTSRRHVRCSCSRPTLLLLLLLPYPRCLFVSFRQSLARFPLLRIFFLPLDSHARALARANLLLCFLPIFRRRVSEFVSASQLVHEFSLWRLNHSLLHVSIYQCLHPLPLLPKHLLPPFLQILIQRRSHRLEPSPALFTITHPIPISIRHRLRHSSLN